MLNIAPLNLTIEAEDIMDNYRCSISDFDKIKKLTDSTIIKLGENEEIFNIGLCDHTIMKLMNAPEYSVVIPEKIERQKVENLLRQHDLVWYTDGSKTKDGVGLGIYNKSMQISISTSLGNLMTVYQAEMLALSKCTETKQIKDRNIVMFGQ